MALLSGGSLRLTTLSGVMILDHTGIYNVIHTAAKNSTNLRIGMTRTIMILMVITTMTTIQTTEIITIPTCTKLSMGLITIRQ